MKTLPLERESKTVLDSGFHPLDPAFKVLDSRFQSVVRFRIPWFVFHISTPKILESTNKYFRDSEFHKQKFPGFQNPRQSWILDSSPYILDSRYGILYSLSVELGFRISIVDGILDSLSCIPDSNAQDSGFHKSNFPDSRFHKQKFPGFPNLDLLTWGERHVLAF